MAHSARPLAVFLAASASIAAVAAPEKAHAAFNFSNVPAVNANSQTFTDAGISLTVDNPVTGFTGGGVNTNASGLCAWLQNSSNLGMPGKRCGYVDGTSAQSATLTGLTFTFDQRVRLKSFDFSSLSGTSSATLTFSQGSKSAAFTVSGTVPSPRTFSPAFTVEANTPLTLTSSGVVSTTTISGEMRINGLEVEAVPGPLPLFGAAAAFGWSRRLRRRTMAATEA